MDSVIFALITFFGWGVADVFTTVSSRRLSAYSATFWSYVFSGIFLTLLVPFNLDSLFKLTLNNFILNLALGGLFMAGVVCFRDALTKGSSPVIVAISSSYAVVTTILSLVFLKETLSWAQSFSVLLVFIGLFLSVLDLNKLFDGKLHYSEGTVLTLFAALFWGIYFAFIKIPVLETGSFWPNYFTFIFFIPVIYLWIKFKKIKLNSLNHNKGFSPLLAGIVISRIAEISFNAGIKSGNSAIVAPIAGADPVFFLILASIFLKDKVTKQQSFGIVLTLVGVILLSYLSV